MSSKETLITSDSASFTDEQRRLIRDVLVKGGSDQEVAFYFQVAERLKLDPFKRQIHAMKRYDGQLRREVLQFMVSIEGLRSIACRCKTEDGKDAYAGSSKPRFTYKDAAKKELHTAEVTILKIVQGEPREFTAEVFFDECVQTKGIYEGPQGNQRKVGEEPNSMWQKRPHGQLAKCAEAAALRKAFPEETGGAYIEEELPPEPESHTEPPKTSKAPKPEAEGMEERVYEAEVAGPRHWSDLMVEGAYKLIIFPEGSPWAGKAIWEVNKDGNFLDAFANTPREGDSDIRMALDCGFFAKLETRLKKKGYDLEQATAALRKVGYLKEDDDLMKVPGEKLEELAGVITDLEKNS